MQTTAEGEALLIASECLESKLHQHLGECSGHCLVTWQRETDQPFQGVLVGQRVRGLWGCEIEAPPSLCREGKMNL